MLILILIDIQYFYKVKIAQATILMQARLIPSLYYYHFFQILFNYSIPMLFLLPYLAECVIIPDNTTCCMYTAAAHITMNENLADTKIDFALKGPNCLCFL